MRPSTRMHGSAIRSVRSQYSKVNVIGEISHLYPSQTLGPIWMPFQIHHYVRPGSRCAKCD